VLLSREVIGHYHYFISTEIAAAEEESCFSIPSQEFNEFVYGQEAYSH
jgi:hypothetical protein